MEPDFYVFDACRPARLRRAAEDVSEGLARWRLALALTRADIRNRYRGSVLGPLWLTLSTAVMVGGLGLLYSNLFRLPLRDYLPFLAVSLLVWNTLNQIVAESCSNLISSEGLIRQIRLPFTTHALRCVLRNAAVAAHSLPLILVVLWWCDALPGAGGLLALAGLALVALAALALSLLLGMVCARFRDVGQIVSSAMQIAFFLSPVLWKPELLGPSQALLPLNPVYALMETVRGPLVAGGAAPLVWAAAVGYTLALCAAAGALFVRFRGRIAFWV